MENEQYMCYITYCVPQNMLPALTMPPLENTKTALPSLYPPGFMPQWYHNGSFPEDDFED